MLALALVLIVLGIIGIFAFAWGGIVVGAVGLILLILFLVGFARRATQTEGP